MGREQSAQAEFLMKTVNRVLMQNYKKFKGETIPHDFKHMIIEKLENKSKEPLNEPSNNKVSVTS